MLELRISPNDVCDFCSDPHPVRRFSAPNFVLDDTTPILQSIGAWLACELCGKFIDEQKWDALELRGVAAMLAKHSGPTNLIRESVQKSRRLFREHFDKFREN